MTEANKQKKMQVLVRKLSENRFFYQVSGMRGKVIGTGITETFSLEDKTFTVGCMEFYNVVKIQVLEK